MLGKLQQGLAITVSFLCADVTNCSYIPAWSRNSRDGTNPQGFNLQPTGPRDPQAGSFGTLEDLKGKAAWAGIKHLHLQSCLGFNGISEKPPKVSKNFMETELSTPFGL